MQQAKRFSQASTHLDSLCRVPKAIANPDPQARITKIVTIDIQSHSRQVDRTPTIKNPLKILRGTDALGLLKLESHQSGIHALSSRLNEPPQLHPIK